MEKYERLQRIGAGQYGVCDKVRCLEDGEVYAIKTIPMVGGKGSAEAALQEAEVLSSLNHPNIVSYKERFIHEEQLCIVTAFCEGGDLYHKIMEMNKAGQSFTEDEVLLMFVQICMGLAHVHQRRILHRDLKTQNIFLTRGGVIKLGDFGISRVLERTDDFATTVTGTPYYMAPEICTNQPYTYKSDIWSLGCVLYELCTLRHAFGANSLLSLVYQIVQGNYPPIDPKRYNSRISAMVSALLCKDATRRPSCLQVLRQEWLQDHVQRSIDQSRMMIKTFGRSRSGGRRSVRQSPPAALGAAGGGGGDARPLSARERLAARKRAIAERRQRELQEAAASTAADREEARRRHQQMFHHSHVELPGAGDTVNYGSTQGSTAGYGTGARPPPSSHMPPVAEASSSSGASARVGGGGGGPAGATGGSTAGSTQSSQSLPDASSVFVGVGAPPPLQGQSPPPTGGWGGAGGDDTGVLMGSPRAGAGATGGGGTGVDGGRYYGGYTDASANVLMGSLAQSTGYGARGGAGYGAGHHATPGGGGGGGYYNGTTDTMATDVYLGLAEALPPGSTRGQSMNPSLRPGPSPPLPAGPPPQPGGGSAYPHQGSPPLPGGGYNARAYPVVSPPSGPPTAASYENPGGGGFGGTDASGVLIGTMGSSASGGGIGSAASTSSEDGDEAAGVYEDDFEDYEDDFEDYEEEEEEQGVSEVITAMRGLGTVAEEEEECPEEDSVSSGAYQTRVGNLRRQAQNELGRDFEPVHGFLRDVRQGRVSASEEEVKRRLVEMVGRSKISACFAVDMLIFAEAEAGSY